MINGLIKICANPHCEAIFHNIPKLHTRCNDCNGWIIIINEKTYWKKFSKNWFQYDFNTGKLYRPKKQIEQLTINF
jgi:hypothetical protein